MTELLRKAALTLLGPTISITEGISHPRLVKVHTILWLKLGYLLLKGFPGFSLTLKLVIGFFYGYSPAVLSLFSSSLGSAVCRLSPAMPKPSVPESYAYVAR